MNKKLDRFLIHSHQFHEDLDNKKSTTEEKNKIVSDINNCIIDICTQKFEKTVSILNERIDYLENEVVLLR